MAQISEETVESAIYSWDDGSEVKNFSKFDSGFAREVLKVEMESGEEIVLYVCTDTSEKYERRFMKEEKLIEVVNQKTDIPTQVILKSDFTKEHIPYFYYIAEKVDGYNPIDRFKYLPRKTKRSIVNKVGKYLGQLHKNVKFSSSGDIIYQNDELEIEAEKWESYLKNWAGNHLQQLEDGRFKDMVEEFENFIDDHIELASTKDSCCVHWDVSPDNLIIKNGGINAVIDWEKAVSGPPEWDLANSRVQMIHRWFETDEINQELEKEFFRGYVSRRDLCGKWRQKVLYFGMIQSLMGMANFEEWTSREGLSRDEINSEEQFFRDIFRKRQKNLEKAAREQINF